MKHCYHLPIILLVLLFGLNSCGDQCTGTTGEPILHLFFTNATGSSIAPGYSRVYAIDGNNEIKGDIELGTNVRSYLLPFSTLENQITYVFEH